MWLSVRLSSLSSIVLVSLLLATGTLFFFSRELITHNEFALAMTYALGMVTLFGDFINALTSTERAGISLERLREYNEIASEDLESGATIEDTQSIQAVGEETAIVEFRNVSLTYQPDGMESSAQATRALDNVTISIRKGERVAICGRYSALPSHLKLL